MELTKKKIDESAARIAARRPKAVVSDTKLPMELLRQAEVKSRHLTQDRNWDTYLTYLQANIESLKVMVEGATAKLVDPKTLDHAEMMAAKMVIVEANAMIRAFTMSIQYPKAIMDAYATIKKNDV